MDKITAFIPPNYNMETTVLFDGQSDFQPRFALSLRCNNMHRQFKHSANILDY